MTTYRFAPSPERPLNLPFRVVVVDDHPLTRRGSVDTINDSTRLAVCGEACTVAGALSVMDATHPDLVTVDVSLGHESGLTLVAAIAARHPDTRSLVVSVHDEESFAARALKAGAWGYLMKDRGPADLLTALHHIAAGGTYLSDAASAHILSTLGRRSAATDAPIDHLTDRERQVLTVIGQGLSTRRDQCAAAGVGEDGRNTLRALEGEARSASRTSARTICGRMAR
jgi:DNA-binding NarL/FixJ family response regulator